MNKNISMTEHYDAGCTVQIVIAIYDKMRGAYSREGESGTHQRANFLKGNEVCTFDVMHQTETILSRDSRTADVRFYSILHMCENDQQQKTTA